MKHLIIYITLIICFLSYYVLKEMEFNIPVLITSYFEDIIAIPIIFTTALLAIQIFFKKFESYRIPSVHIVILTILFSAYFEIVLPGYNPTFTADTLDIVCYGLGAIFFAVFLNRPYFTNVDLRRS